MNKYTRIARVYPSLVGMIIPWIIIVWSLGDYLFKLQENFGRFFSYIGMAMSSALILGAIGYSLRETFRSVSKWIFQFPFFKEDETKMPTTEMLLWKNKSISKEYHNNIAKKCYSMFHIRLLSEEKEFLDEREARLTIVNAVQQMREVTRDNKILLQYNYEFGFCRNYLGVVVFDILFIIIMLIINSCWNLMPQIVIWILGGIVIISALIALCSLKYRAKAYARSLFSSFMAKPLN